jgi:hypothetical protein
VSSAKQIASLTLFMVSSLLHQGKIYQPHSSPYALIIFPWVQLKKLFQSLYALLLRLLWAELIEGEAKDNDLLSLLLFVFFLGLAWVSFRLTGLLPWLMLSFFVLWYLDYSIAYRAYGQGRYQRTVTLSLTEAQTLHWQTQLSRQAPLVMEFEPQQIRQLAITVREIRGGAFGEPLARVWQLQIILLDHSDWVIEEDVSLERILPLAHSLATRFAVRCIFAGSQGWGDYAERGIDTQQIALKNKEKAGLGCRITAHKWYIFSRWRWHNSLALIKEIVQRSGFLIFVLLMSGLMVQIGGFLDNFFVARQAEEPIIINFYLPLRTIFAGYSWPTFLSVIAAIAVMVYRGWQLSRVKQSVIDRHFLRVSLEQESIGKLPTQEIISGLFLSTSPPMLWLLTPSQALAIPPLPCQEDNLRYLQAIYEGIQALYIAPEPDAESSGE